LHRLWNKKWPCVVINKFTPAFIDEDELQQLNKNLPPIQTSRAHGILLQPSQNQLHNDENENTVALLKRIYKEIKESEMKAEFKDELTPYLINFTNQFLDNILNSYFDLRLKQFSSKSENKKKRPRDLVYSAGSDIGVSSIVIRTTKSKMKKLSALV